MRVYQVKDAHGHTWLYSTAEKAEYRRVTRKNQLEYAGSLDTHVWVAEKEVE